MKQVGRMDEIERTKRIVHHRYNMVFFKDRATVDRIENLLQVGLNELNHKENLFEAFHSDVLVIVKLLLNDIFA